MENNTNLHEEKSNNKLTYGIRPAELKMVGLELAKSLAVIKYGSIGAFARSMGYSRCYLSMIFLGWKNPPLKLKKEIASRLGIPIERIWQFEILEETEK